MANVPQHYAGKVTQVGNSKGIRLDAAFFKAHPEFGGAVQATVLAEGQVLLSAKAKRRGRGKKSAAPDPRHFVEGQFACRLNASSPFG